AGAGRGAAGGVQRHRRAVPGALAGRRPAGHPADRRAGRRAAALDQARGAAAAGRAGPGDPADPCQSAPGLAGRGRPRRGGGALLAGPWGAFVAANHIVDPAFLPITLATLQANLSRWPTIVGLEWISLTNPWWSYLWPLAGLVGVLTWRRPRPAATRPARLLL